MTVTYGQEVTLIATVKGSEPITVAWVQDKDHILRDGDNRKITFENNQIALTIFKADSTTAGKYTCQIKNDAGVAECMATLTVLGLYHQFLLSHFPLAFSLSMSFLKPHNCFEFTEPASILDKTESVSVTAGDLAVLECSVTGTPELKPKWYKDGVELTSGHKYKTTFSKGISSLKVLSTGKGDTGDYTFEVKNEVGSDSCKMTITVLGQ